MSIDKMDFIAIGNNDGKTPVTGFFCVSRDFASIEHLPEYTTTQAATFHPWKAVRNKARMRLLKKRKGVVWFMDGSVFYWRKEDGKIIAKNTFACPIYVGKNDTLEITHTLRISHE